MLLDFCFPHSVPLSRWEKGTTGFPLLAAEGLTVRMARTTINVLRCGSSLAVPSSIAVEKACDSPDCIGQVIRVRQEHDAKMVGSRAIESGALHQQHPFLG